MGDVGFSIRVTRRRAGRMAYVLDGRELVPVQEKHLQKSVNRTLGVGDRLVDIIDRQAALEVPQMKPYAEQ